jgi:hypothetical protein
MGGRGNDGTAFAPCRRGIMNLGSSNATAVTLVDTLPQFANCVAAGASQSPMFVTLFSIVMVARLVMSGWAGDLWNSSLRWQGEPFVPDLRPHIPIHWILTGCHAHARSVTASARYFVGPTGCVSVGCQP